MVEHSPGCMGLARWVRAVTHHSPTSAALAAWGTEPPAWWGTGGAVSRVPPVLLEG